MEITLDKITSTEALIKIKLKKTDYQPKVDVKIRDYGKKASLRGFRPGKVPISIIKKMYGKAIVAEEINELLSANLNNYIKEKELPILIEPIPNMSKNRDIDWENQTDFEFEYTLAMAGDFDLKPEKVSVNRYTIQVNDKLIDQTIENLRKHHGELLNPDESAEGDLVFGDITHLTTGITNTHALDLEKVEKKERKKFIGVKKGDKVVFEMKKALNDTYEASHLLGIAVDEYKKLEGDFELTVKNINRQLLCEVNQELFDKIYGQQQIKDLTEFRARVRQSISENYAVETENFLKKSIKEALIEKTKVELPEDFLRSRYDESANGEGKLTKEELDHYFPDYLKDVKWSIFQNKIIKENEIKVENAQVFEEAKRLIRMQFSQTPQFAGQLEENIEQFAHNYLRTEEGKNFRQLYDQLLSAEIFKLLTKKVDIKEKSISANDFNKLTH